MPRPKIVHCKRCGGHYDQVGPLSRRKLCESCSIEGVTAAATAMYVGSGPIYERWLEGSARALARKIEAAASVRDAGR